jgi:hypothetical protein
VTQGTYLLERKWNDRILFADLLCMPVEFKLGAPLVCCFKDYIVEQFFSYVGVSVMRRGGLRSKANREIKKYPCMLLEFTYTLVIFSN